MGYLIKKSTKQTEGSLPVNKQISILTGGGGCSLFEVQAEGLSNLEKRVLVLLLYASHVSFIWKSRASFQIKGNLGFL